MSDAVLDRESDLRRIVGRLLARLEGIRRVYVGNPERTSTEFRRIASEHLRGELRQRSDEDEGYTNRLETEVQESLIPRYTRAAVEMNQREESGFGFGAVASTAGRLISTFISLLIIWVFKLRLVMVPSFWPLFILVVSFPFWPDIVAAVYRAHYRRSLDEVVDDFVRLLLNSPVETEAAGPGDEL